MEDIKEQITSETYTLRYNNGAWLAQIVITSDGMFAAVSDWGNFSFAWRSIGKRSFKDFLKDLGTDYFASKMMSGMSYVSSGKKVERACTRFSEKVLPVFQKMLKEEQKSTI